MNDQQIRESLNICLSASSFPAYRKREVLERIQGSKPVMKRRITAAVVLAACMMLALCALAVAAGLGVFGQLAENENSFVNGVRLGHLEEAADTLNESAVIAAPTPAVTPSAATLFDELMASQSNRTFELTINQTYCDGRNLYYTYTLKTDAKGISFGEGRPSGFDEFEWAEPGKRFAEVWHIDPPETYQAMCDWFDGAQSRYIVMDSVSVGDGVSVADGSEKGIPTMIFDSAEEWIDETTLQGFQQVELPEAYAPGETFDVLMTVLYGTTVYYQDETGVYRQHIAQSENRGILRIPFTVTVGGRTKTLTGTVCTDTYAAHASLTFTDVTAYGEVVFDAPEWAAAYQAEIDYYMNGIEGESPVMPDMISSYQLVAGEEVLRNVSGGFGLNDEGKYHVLFEFNLPVNMENLKLVPTDEAFENDIIDLNPTP